MSRMPPSTRRRSALALPARWPHIFAALGVLAALIIGLPSLALTFGDARDAKPDGSVVVAALPESEQPSPLDQANNLPDLLAAEALIGDNPTDNIAEELAANQTTEVDALGNPIANPNNGSTPETLTLPVRNANALAPIDPTLRRSGRFGDLPGPNPAGLTPLAAYKRPTNQPAARGTVSIIVGGLGINARLTQRAIDELPPNVSLSFAAHAPDLQTWIDAARQAGHEVFLEVPMESAGFDPSEPGAVRAIRSEASVGANRDNLHRLLAQAKGYAGVINYNGDRVMPRSDIVAPLLSELQASGLGFVADGSFAAPSLPALARSVDLPFQTAFGLIDPSPERLIIDSRLNELAARANSQAGTIGVGFAYPQTIDALKGWTATLKSDGLTLIPASAALE